MRRLLGLLVSGVALGAGLGVGMRLVRDERVVAATAAVPPDFTDVARRSTPAVVNISALQVLQAQRSPFFSDPFFREFFGQDLPFRIPHEERKTSLGSGVLVSPDGVIVTNNHVIEKSRQIEITTFTRRRYRARLVGTDPVTDIAVLRIEGRQLDTLPWGDSSRSRVGEYVLAVGNPFRLNQTVTMGIISAVGRSNIGIVDYEDFIQTDAAINPGNSGGALVNTRGELIGINTAIYSETGGYQGIGFAVPANLARQVVDDLLAYGHVRRGFVGITRIRDVGAAEARELGMASAEGALVLELLRGSPAHRAGLEPGDVVISVDGRAIVDAAQLRHELAGARPGVKLQLEVLRNGRKRSLEIDVQGAPTDA